MREKAGNDETFTIRFGGTICLARRHRPDVCVSLFPIARLVTFSAKMCLQHAGRCTSTLGCRSSIFDKHIKINFDYAVRVCVSSVLASTIWREWDVNRTTLCSSVHTRVCGRRHHWSVERTENIENDKIWIRCAIFIINTLRQHYSCHREWLQLKSIYNPPPSPSPSAHPYNSAHTQHVYYVHHMHVNHYKRPCESMFMNFTRS